MRTELIGLKGGSKQHYIRLHYREIKEYYFQHGAEATRREFRLEQQTLEALLQREGYYSRLNKLSENDKWVYRAAMDVNRDTNRRVAVLERWREEVEPVIEIGRGIVATLAQLQPQSQKKIKPADPLSLADFGGKLRK